MAEEAQQAPADVQPGVVPPGFRVQQEGQASVLLQGTSVFYNEAQVTNRDLSVAVLRQFLPVLQQEHQEGKYRRSIQQRRQQRALVNTGWPRPAPYHAKPGPQPPVDQSQQQQAGDDAEQDEEQAEEAGDAQEKGSETHQGQQGAAPTQEKNEGSGQGGSDAKTTKKGGPRHWGATILEGLAASGLRAIRYAKEVPYVRRVDANDLDASACEAIRRNVTFNGPEVSGCVNVLHSDARITMMHNPLEYDVIDLDPYGTPAQLLDSAVQSVADGGLMCVTATDMANLCGNNSPACWANYGSYPLHRACCHEMALRILLATIEGHANRYKRYIQPLLSLSIDFYVRVFVRVFTSPSVTKDASTRLAYVWQATGCDSYWLQRIGEKRVNGNSVKHGPGHGPAVPDIKCPDSGSGYIMTGPAWAEPLHDTDFVAGLIAAMEADKDRYAAYTRIRGLLTSVAEELPDVPLFYNLHDLCKTVRVTPMKQETFKSALINAGYRVSGSHANPLAIKTDAPPSVVWDLIRCWVKDHPVNIKVPTSAAAVILSKEPSIQANFARAANAVRKPDAPPRFVQNPAGWGPKSRAGRDKQKKQQDGVQNGEEAHAGTEPPAEAAPAAEPVEAAVAAEDQQEEQPAKKAQQEEQPAKKARLD